MQFREKGHRVQCVRSEYRAERKRSIGRVVASQHSDHDEVMTQVQSVLSNEEAQEFEAWLDKRRKERDAKSAKCSFTLGPTAIDRITKSLGHSAVKSTLDVIHVAQLYSSIDRLTKALRREGYTRPKVSVIPTRAK